MRKLFYVLLILVLAVSLLSVPSLAADGSSMVLQVEASSKDLNLESTVTYTFTLLSQNKPVTGVTFSYTIPDGMTQTSATPLSQDKFPANKPGLEGTKFTCLDVNNPVTAASIPLLTVTCKVDKTSALEEKTLEITELEVTDNNSQGIQKYDGVQPKIDTVTVSHSKDQHVWEGGRVENRPAATCTTGGTKITHCATPGCNGTKEDPVSATGHDITFGDVKWNIGAAPTATIHVTCKNKGCEYYGDNGAGVDKTVETSAIDIDPGKTTATCTQGGSITYTFTYTIPDSVKKPWTTTQTHMEETEPLGHDWSSKDAKVTWSWDGYDSATATLVCGNNLSGDACTITKTVTTGNGIVKVEKPSCSEEGTNEYTATVDFSSETDGAREIETNKVTETTQPTGHMWSPDVDTVQKQIIWNEEAGNYTIKNKDDVKVKCENPWCSEYKDAKALDWTVDDEVTKPATCEGTGITTWTATAPSLDGKTPGMYTVSKEEVTPALGHDYPDTEDDLEITWADDYSTATAKRVCSRDATHVEEIKVNTTNEEVSAATYLKGSVTRYSATFTSEESKALDITVEKEVEADDKLEPTFGGTVEGLPDVTSSVDMVALQKTVASATTATLEDNPPSWLPADIKEAILKAGATEDDMNVSMKVVVTSLSQQLPTITGADVKDAYDIHIDMTVTGGGLSDPVTAQVETVPEEITFTVPVPTAGGPIWYVMTDHGGPWAKIEGSKVENGSIVFSSKQFSDFAIISSNDLKDAKIEAIPDQTYTGKAITPKVKVTINGGQELTENVDYTVTYSNNTDKGTAKVTIKPVKDAEGNSRFTGSNTATFQIKAASSGGSGSGSGNGSGSGSPETGDETPLALYAALLTASLAALAATLLVLRKQRQK